MIKLIQQPVVFDGLLYVAIAVFGYLNTTFGSDEAAKFLSPVSLFWTRTIVGAFAAGALGLKMYRSTTFAEYRQAKNGSYHEVADSTTIKTNETKTP